MNRACGYLGGSLGSRRSFRDFFYDALEFASFFSGVQFLLLALSVWPQDVQKRYPNHLWMQKSGVPKKLAPLRKSKVFSLGIPVEIQLFRFEAANASHRDSKIQSDSRLIPLPHSARNFKKKVFGFFLLPSSVPALCLNILPAQAPTNPAVNQLLMLKKPHLWISGVFFCDFSFLFTCCWLVHASLFAPVPSIFSSGHPSRFQSTLSCASPLWDRTIAFVSPFMLIVIVFSSRFFLRSSLVSLFSLLFALVPRVFLGPTLFCIHPPFWDLVTMLCV